MVGGVLLDGLVDVAHHAGADEGAVHGEGFILLIDQVAMDDPHAPDDLGDAPCGGQFVSRERLARYDLGVEVAGGFLLPGFREGIGDHLRDWGDLLVADEGS